MVSAIISTPKLFSVRLQISMMTRKSTDCGLKFSDLDSSPLYQCVPPTLVVEFNLTKTLYQTLEYVRWSSFFRWGLFDTFPIGPTKSLSQLSRNVSSSTCARSTTWARSRLHLFSCLRQRHMYQSQRVTSRAGRGHSKCRLPHQTRVAKGRETRRPMRSRRSGVLTRG
jgi:hypothetical protein